MLKHLSKLEQRTEELIQERRDTLTKGILNWMLKQHNHISGCGCDYCCTLLKYTELIKEARTAKHKMNDDRYYTWGDDIYQLESNYLRAKHNVRMFKEEKDKLKSLTIVPSIRALNEAVQFCLHV